MHVRMYDCVYVWYVRMYVNNICHIKPNSNVCAARIHAYTHVYVLSAHTSSCGSCNDMHFIM